MAVVSLSRIQVRRGKTNGQPLPQLASGEIAWAIDTRELYIGSGSTAEGAPDESNVRILTQQDNIFESYAYKNLPVSKERSLQDRLDDYVSLRAFDGNDDTERLQNAINELFGYNRSNTQAVILYIEPGIYTLTDTISLPPNTKIQGSGIGRTIFRILNNTIVPAFKTVTTEGRDGNNNIIFFYPENLYIDGITVDVSEAKPLFNEALPVEEQLIKPTMLLEGTTYSKFSNIEIVGNSANITQNAGVILDNAVIGSDFIINAHNTFDNFVIRHCNNAFYSKADLVNNTWKNCTFEYNTISIYINNSNENPLYTPRPLGSSTNTFENCWFDHIAQNAIKIVRSSGNISRGNKYINVGNVENTPVYNVINFGGDISQEFVPVGNISENDWFQRSLDLPNSSGSPIPYVPEIKGNVIYENKFKHHVRIVETSSLLGIDLNFNLYCYGMQIVEVNYQYKDQLRNNFRYGTLSIAVNSEDGSISFNDDFSYIDSVTGFGNPGDITFAVAGENYSGGDYTFDTLIVSVLNLTDASGNNTNADFYYSVKYIN